jgi:bifunctional UDP-N-acetylglucosamine pyrophosphorylase/glucosamine-1-phosphate N-acetyltransferase
MRTVVVVGFESDAVRAGLGTDIDYAQQTEQRGTGDAVRAALPQLEGFAGDVLVLAGDVPLLRPETLAALLQRHRETGAAATLLTAFLDDPTGYGRVVRHSDGTVGRIVEHRDATAEERAIKEWNPSIYCFKAAALLAALAEIRADNAQGEYYLTDTIGVLARAGSRIEAMPAADADEALGVNTQIELAHVRAIMTRRILDALMLAGVSIVDPASTYVDAGVAVGAGTILHPQTFLHAGASIGVECEIGPCTRISASQVGDRTTIAFSQVTGCKVGDDVRIGPFAHLRPGCNIGAGTKIGDFVELKNANVGEGVSAAHLSYIGDADVGSGANIGAGVVTCNYDGVRKHRTRIGANAFIGTNSTLIAPVSIEDGAYVAAGSPINEDVPADALAIARTRPVIKPEWARRWRERRK